MGAIQDMEIIGTLDEKRNLSMELTQIKVANHKNYFFFKKIMFIQYSPPTLNSKQLLVVVF